MRGRENGEEVARPFQMRINGDLNRALWRNKVMAESRGHDNGLIVTGKGTIKDKAKVTSLGE